MKNGERTKKELQQNCDDCLPCMKQGTKPIKYFSLLFHQKEPLGFLLVFLSRNPILLKAPNWIKRALDPRALAPLTCDGS
jgi:hypothetical protein